MGLVSLLREAICPELTGRDLEGVRLEGHRHGSFIPLDIDGDGQLDHFLLYAPMGFGAVAQRALRAIRKTYSKGAAKPLFLTLAGMGKRVDFAHLGQTPVRELAEARVWTSR